ncbi:MAG: hypothetical protein ACOYN3_08185 [Acidimicrobiia bacterium]
MASESTLAPDMVRIVIRINRPVVVEGRQGQHVIAAGVESLLFNPRTHALYDGHCRELGTSTFDPHAAWRDHVAQADGLRESLFADYPVAQRTLDGIRFDRYFDFSHQGMHLARIAGSLGETGHSIPETLAAELAHADHVVASVEQRTRLELDYAHGAAPVLLAVTDFHGATHQICGALHTAPIGVLRTEMLALTAANDLSAGR